MSSELAGPSMLALVADMSGPTLWRVLQPFTALQKTGYRADWDFKSAAGLGAVAPLYDGYLLSRLSWPPEHHRLSAAWFELIRDRGRFVVYDADDDLFTSELTHRSIALGWDHGKSFEQLEADRAERIWAMQAADGVTVSTQRLATIARSFTPRPVVVVPNAIDLAWFRSVARAAGRQIAGLTIGWAGGQRPDDDVRAMAEAWGRIAEEHPEVRFVVVGHFPAVVGEHVPGDRVYFVDWLPLERYPQGLAQLDIACCAVADTRFNRCKSPIKAYEAAAAGSAVVATRTLYGSTVEHERSGYLAETVDEWHAALSSLVASPARRRIMARRLLRHVERRCSLAENLWKWPDAWELIADDARSRRGRLVAV